MHMALEASNPDGPSLRHMSSYCYSFSHLHSYYDTTAALTGIRQEHKIVCGFIHATLRPIHEIFPP